MKLTKSQLEFWQKNRFLHLTDFLDIAAKKQLVNWCHDLQQRPESPGQWMKYFESTCHNKRTLCRVENFLQYHDGFSELARGPRTMSFISQLMGEKAVLFKEKINFKLAGANGFTAHQDYPAFISFGQSYHITLMVAIDASTIENGCLQVVPGGQYIDTLLPQAQDKTIATNTAENLNWQPVPCDIGDILVFDSFLPHYSEPNHSTNSRRALFLTYNRYADGGSKRDAYYADKRKRFPPECERIAGVDYSAGEAIYNVANPINNEVVE